MKLVYIASPLRGDYNQNIKNAVKYCKNACNSALAIAPHIVFSQWCNDSIPRLLSQQYGALTLIPFSRCVPPQGRKGILCGR